MAILEIKNGSIVQAKTDVEYCHRKIKAGERFKVISDFWVTSGSGRKGKWELVWAQICVDGIADRGIMGRDFMLVCEENYEPLAPAFIAEKEAPTVKKCMLKRIIAAIKG